jgi:cob(I)alamin adenosyltransferase
VKIYTRGGDDGTTGRLFGGRVAKDDSGPESCGAVDEAVSALGLARVAAAGPAAAAILEVQRELFVVGAELATAAGKRSRLQPGVSLVTAEMVQRREAAIDALDAEVGTPTGFVVPGGTPAAAALDQARAVVRRAERRAVTHLRAAGIEGSQVVPYLNRLGDYLYMLARAAEGEWTPSRREEERR